MQALIIPKLFLVSKGVTEHDFDVFQEILLEQTCE